MELGSGALVHPGRDLPPGLGGGDSRRHRTVRRRLEHAFRSDLDRIDQYSGCGCEVVVTDPIDDVAAMWRALESDRIALGERIRALSGYDLAQAQSSSDSQT